MGCSCLNNIYIYICVCVCVHVCGTQREEGCMVITTVGGFPFSHWCIKLFLVKHLACRGRVLLFKNHPAKTASKIHRSSVFMFAFRILGSSKKIAQRTPVGGFPFSHRCTKTCPINPLSCRGVVLFFFKNHPAKIESKIHRSSVFLFAFSLLGSSTKSL